MIASLFNACGVGFESSNFQEGSSFFTGELRLNYKRVCYDPSEEVAEDHLKMLTPSQIKYIIQDVTTKSLPATLVGKIDNLPKQGKQYNFDNNARASKPNTVFFHVLKEFAMEASKRLAIGPQFVGSCSNIASVGAASTCFINGYKKVAPRLLRKKMSSSEITKAKNLYSSVFGELTEGNKSKDASVLVLETLFMNPRFIYRKESWRSKTGSLELNAYELASRLSFYLGSTVPDDELIALANNNQILDEAVLVEQADRLIVKHRNRFTKEFFGQWLSFREKLGDTRTIASNINYDEFARESYFVFAELLSKDVSPAELLDPGFTYVNQNTAPVYGLASTSASLKKVNGPYGGILRQGNFLSGSYSGKLNGDGVVGRGVYVLDKLLCAKLPNLAPSTLAEINSFNEAHGGLNPDEKSKVRLSNTKCASCHNLIDGIGIGLETFDSLGSLRAKYPDNKAITADGKLLGIKYSGLGELNQILAREEQYSDCVKKQVFSYAVGSNPKSSLGCSLESSDGGDVNMGLKTFILNFTNSQKFRLTK